MRRTILASALISFVGVYVSPACAWRDAGHMQIAYVAYKHLDAPVKVKVDALLKLNADYSKWTAGASDEKTAKLYAFVHAATWADDIKRKEYGYTRDNVNSTTAGQNIGYSDHNQHAYWHFKDINFSPDGTPLPPPDPVDLVTQLKLMIAALPASSGTSDDVRSYDLMWIFHLVGDAHQPLHAGADLPHRFRTGTLAATPNPSSLRPVRPSRFMLIGIASLAVILRPSAPFSTPTPTTGSPASG